MTINMHEFREASERIATLIKRSTDYGQSMGIEVVGDGIRIFGCMRSGEEGNPKYRSETTITAQGLMDAPRGHLISMVDAIATTIGIKINDD